MSVKTNKKLPIILISVGLFLGITGLLFQDKLKIAVAGIQTSIENQGKPKFSFDTSQFPDWATAGNVYTNPNDFTDGHSVGKDDLPISNINVTQCEPGSNCSKLVKECDPWHDDKPSCKALAQATINTNCFVMAFYNERKVDPKQEVLKYIDNIRSFGDMTIEETNTKTLSMGTFEGEKSYKLHYYEYQKTSGQTMKSGNAIGYVSLENGRVEIRSICSEVNQIDETLPVLSNIRLEL